MKITDYGEWHMCFVWPEILILKEPVPGYFSLRCIDGRVADDTWHGAEIDQLKASIEYECAKGR